MKNKIGILLLFIWFIPPCLSKHVYKENSYQEVWCKNHNGILEYKNKDNTRVDCLTSTHAVEFDFAPKWAESIGQALYYGVMTGKKPMVVLILENPKKEYIYLDRVKFMAKTFNFDVDCMTLNSITNNKK